MSSQFGNRGRPGNVGGYKVRQMQNFTPEQMELFRSLFSHVSPDSYTSRLASGDQELFAEIETPA